MTENARFIFHEDRPGVLVPERSYDQKLKISGGSISLAGMVLVILFSIFNFAVTALNGAHEFSHFEVPMKIFVAGIAIAYVFGQVIHVFLALTVPWIELDQHNKEIRVYGNSFKRALLYQGDLSKFKLKLTSALQVAGKTTKVNRYCLFVILNNQDYLMSSEVFLDLGPKYNENSIMRTLNPLITAVSMFMLDWVEQKEQTSDYEALAVTLVHTKNKWQLGYEF